MYTIARFRADVFHRMPSMAPGLAMKRHLLYTLLSRLARVAVAVTASETVATGDGRDREVEAAASAMSSFAVAERRAGRIRRAAR
jgi:hypothetical protein